VTELLGQDRPLLISIHLEVPAVRYKEARVVAARNRQLERYRGEQRTYQRRLESNRKHGPKAFKPGHTVPYLGPLVLGLGD
jgi:hypothetical protein